MYAKYAVKELAAKNGLTACFMAKPIPGAPKKLPSDYVASSMPSFREVVEEINGYSFRTASTEIKPSRYAPG